jgi:prophage regulatory protein
MTPPATVTDTATTDAARRYVHLTRKQVAQLYGVSEDTITEWVKAGKFPPPLRLSARTHRWRWADLPA